MRPNHQHSCESPFNWTVQLDKPTNKCPYTVNFEVQITVEPLCALCIHSLCSYLHDIPNASEVQRFSSFLVYSGHSVAVIVHI